MHAELLTKQGNYHDVQVAFLKEEPLIDDCLKKTVSSQVVIVPDFLAEGYFTRQIIPKKLWLENNPQHLSYCPPVGTHPLMGELIAEAASVVLGDWNAQETSLLVVGHGSGKNPCSRQTLMHHLQNVREMSDFAQVADLWLEESPRVSEWSEIVTKDQVIVLPYLLNDGQHGDWDIPADLGLEKGSVAHGVTHTLNGCAVRIAPALGKSPRFADAISAIAEIWVQKNG